MMVHENGISDFKALSQRPYQVPAYSHDQSNQHGSQSGNPEYSSLDDMQVLTDGN